MNPDVKAAWVAALRSGAYTQGTGMLRRDLGGKVEHCCLGVLHEVMRPGEPVPAAGWLPTRLVYEAGLPRHEHANLVSLNDRCGYDFSQIAAYVEARL